MATIIISHLPHSRVTNTHGLNPRAGKKKNLENLYGVLLKLIRRAAPRFDNKGILLGTYYAPVMRSIRNNLRNVSTAFSRIIRYARPRTHACTHISVRTCVCNTHENNPRESRSRKRVRFVTIFTSAKLSQISLADVFPDQIPISNRRSPPLDPLIHKRLFICSLV